MSQPSLKLVVTLKDNQENAQLLCEYFKRPNVLNVTDLSTFVTNLVSLYKSTQLTVDGKTYLYTVTLFQDAMQRFIEHHYSLIDQAQSSRAIFGHFVLLYVTAQQTKQTKVIGDAIVSTIPMTEYTFRLDSAWMPAIEKVMAERRME